MSDWTTWVDPPESRECPEPFNPVYDCHEVSVVVGVALWWAECSCGWMGPARTAGWVADMDLSQHRSWVENDPDTLDRFGRP